MVYNSYLHKQSQDITLYIGSLTLAITSADPVLIPSNKIVEPCILLASKVAIPGAALYGDSENGINLIILWGSIIVEDSLCFADSKTHENGTWNLKTIISIIHSKGYKNWIKNIINSLTPSKVLSSLSLLPYPVI